MSFQLKLERQSWRARPKVITSAKSTTPLANSKLELRFRIFSCTEQYIAIPDNCNGTKGRSKV